MSTPQTSTDPSSRDTTSTYGANGNLKTETSPDGSTTTYTYDGYDNVTGISYSDGSTHGVSYSYNTDGTVSQMTDGTGTTSYSYDGQGNISSETNGAGSELQYGWDPAGDMTSETFPDGHTATYAYNHRNDMSSLTDWLGNITRFTYDDAGNLKTETLPNGTVTTRTYDSAERLDKMATTGTVQFSFDASGTNGLAPDGNIQTMTTTDASGLGLTPAGTDSYQYDPLSRMTADTETGSGANSANETYSNNGEMKVSDGTGGTAKGTYDYNANGLDAGEVKDITNGSSTTSFGFDQSGNRTACTGPVSMALCDGTTSASYVYDAQNRLISLSNAGDQSVTLEYDGNGLLQRRVAKTPGTICPSIALDGGREPLASRLVNSFVSSFCTYESDLTWNTASGDPTLAVDQEYATGVDEGHTDFIMGPVGLPVEQLIVSGSASTPDWYYEDFQGNTRALLDQSGNAMDVYNEPPWGLASTSGGYTGTPLQYAGTYTDGWTGLVYDQARWYDPETGQFMSQDPLSQLTVQPYAYASDDPIGAGDPTGLWTYHRQRAAAYADRFARHPNNTCQDARHMIWRQGFDGATNPDNCLYYDVWDSDTCCSHNDDCANFASQALYAGGMPLVGNDPNYTGTNVWWARWLGSGLKSPHVSNSWTVAPKLFDFLKRRGLGSAKKYKERELASGGHETHMGHTDGLQPGDLLFYHWGDDGPGINHVAVQSDHRNRNGAFAGNTVDQHSSSTTWHEWWGEYPDMATQGNTYEERNAVVYAFHINR